MKWVTLLKDIKEKVGLTQSASAPSSASSSSPSSSSSSSAPASSARDSHASFPIRRPGSASSPPRSNLNPTSN